jgi:hypothetical protein
VFEQGVLTAVLHALDNHIPIYGAAQISSSKFMPSLSAHVEKGVQIKAIFTPLNDVPPTLARTNFSV